MAHLFFLDFSRTGSYFILAYFISILENQMKMKPDEKKKKKTR